MTDRFNVERALAAGASEDDILKYLSSRAPQFNANLALKSGASKRQVIDYLSENAAPGSEDVVAAASRGKQKAAEAKQVEEHIQNAPDTRMQTAENVGEFIGGTAGAIAGGGLGVPTGIGAAATGAIGAGVGSAAGRRAGKLFGKAMGYPETPDPAGIPEWQKDVASFGMGALGEGMGRMVPAAGRAGSAATRNLFRSRIPTAQREVAEAAMRQNVPVRAAMVSPTARMAEQIVEKIPTARNVVMRGRLSAQVPWEANLERIASGLYPETVSKEGVGAALRQGQQANASAMGLFRKPYQKVEEQLAKSSIDAAPLKVAAMELQSQMPEEGWKWVPGGLRDKITRFAQLGEEQPAVVGASDELEGLARSQTRKSYANLSPSERQGVDELARRIGIDVPEATSAVALDTELPMTMTGEEAMGLRTALLEAERSLGPDSPAITRQAVNRFRTTLDRTIDTSIANKSEAERAALKDWRKINSEYRSYRQQVFGPPPHKPEAGNPMARNIAEAKNPDTLPTQATASPTVFKQTQTAVSPTTRQELRQWVSAHNTGLPEPPPLPPGPLPADDPTRQLQRWYLDDAIGRSRVPAPLNPETRPGMPRWEDRTVSPMKLETALGASKPSARETATAVLGPDTMGQLNEAADVGKAIWPRDINPSGTSTGSEGIREFFMSGRGIGLTAQGLGAAAGLKGALGGDDPSDKLIGAAGIAASLYGPRFLAKRLMAPVSINPERLGLRPGGPISGAIGRLTAKQFE